MNRIIKRDFFHGNFIRPKEFFRTAVVFAGSFVLLAWLLGCSQQNATFQMNRARASNLDSGDLLEKSSKAVNRIDQINVELATKVESLRAESSRVEIQADRCEAEAAKSERKFSKKSSVSKKPEPAVVKPETAPDKPAAGPEVAATKPGLPPAKEK